jgi:tRNA threonylcarbamoyladenosine biosynthesis protein TsaB
MALILNIDTAGQQGLVVLAKDGITVASQMDVQPMQHASFLQPAVQRLMAETGYTLQQLDAIAVSNGPGSYTGLRVGLASAKGLCHALNKPLLTLSTLQVMAKSAIDENSQNPVFSSLGHAMPTIFCPMIDARRMEVFFGLYDAKANELLAPSAVIVTEEFLQEQLSQNAIVFFGNGADKWQKIAVNANAYFLPQLPIPSAALSTLSYQVFLQNDFADLAYSEPFYCKEFYNVGAAAKSN